MHYVSVQPDNIYFRWQIQVQINNFKKHGIEDKMIVIMGYQPELGISPETLKLSETTKAKFFFYEDKRDAFLKSYIPSIRPYLLKQFFLQYPKRFHNKAWMYHDCDIIFRALPKIKGVNATKIIHLSDTASYLDSGYIKSKSPDLFKELCKIVRVRPDVVVENDNRCGGAQYVFGGQAIVGAAFWDKVMNDSVYLFKHMEATKAKYCPEHPIQSWTADMWAILWNLWYMGYQTEISSELSFSWPVDNISNWENHKILHNAGVTVKDNHLFFKGRYIDHDPFNEMFENIDKNYLSYKYVQEILETKQSLNVIS